jgi:hypothetical protein
MELQGGGLCKRRSEESKSPKSSQARLSEVKKQQLRKYSKAAEKAPDAEVDPPKTKKQPFSIDIQRAIKLTEVSFQRPQDEQDRDRRQGTHNT